MAITRPVNQISSRRFTTCYERGSEFDLLKIGFSGSFDKRKWSKRVRQYFRKWNAKELSELS